MHRNLELAGFSLGFAVLAAHAAVLLEVRDAAAADLSWKGYTWSVTDGGMAGVANGSADNVSVDGAGYLHLKIQKNGNTWTAAELFTTTKLGFGTYQWQVDGPIDTMDKNVVLGLFPYGPAAGIGADGTNEIDIEYSRWGQANGPNGDWTDYPASGSMIGEFTYTFSLSGGTLSTSRFIWTKSSIENFLLEGLEPVTSTAHLLKTWKYSPQNPTTNIPQQALPLGINLWCFAIPSDGKNLEIVIRDFQFVPEGTDPRGGAGGATGAGGSAAGGHANAAGRAAAGGGASGGASGGALSGGGLAAGGDGISAGGTPSIAGGTSANAGAPSNAAGRASGGATSAGGVPSNGGAGAGGARSVGGALTSNAGATPGGTTALSRGGAADHGPVDSPDMDAEELGGCSIGGVNGARYGGSLAWLGALPLFVSRRLRRRARR